MYEHVTNDAPPPFALLLAYECLPGVQWGRIVFGRYLNGGAWMDQDERELTAMRESFRAWYIWSYMPAHEMDWTEHDAKFVDWVLDGYE